MRTAHLRQPYMCPQMNKFEQVSCDDHQMSLAGGSKVWCPEEGVPIWPFLGGNPPCDIPPLPVNRQMPWKHYLHAKVFAGSKYIPKFKTTEK